MTSSPVGLRNGYTALVIGATGGIGGAVYGLIERDPRCHKVMTVDRCTYPEFDLQDESSIAAIAGRFSDLDVRFDLIFDATGALTIDGHGPEKTIYRLDASAMAAQFAINAMGPALLLKYFSPMLAKGYKSVFASLSARVGSIGDNRLGGWISYRAAKAALNQIMRTASIEIARKNRHAICVVLHPGTVKTALSDPFASGHSRSQPAQAASQLLKVIAQLESSDNGGFFAYDGKTIDW